MILSPVRAGELDINRLPCRDRSLKAQQDGMLRSPVQGIFDFFVTVLAKTNTLVEFGFYRGPGSAMCAADPEVLPGRIKMMEGQGTLTPRVTAQLTAAALLLDASRLQCKPMTVHHARAAHLLRATSSIVILVVTQLTSHDLF